MQIDENKLADELEYAMAEVTDMFYDINCGGCGAMASILGRALEPYFPVRVAVHHYNTERDFYYIKNNTYNGDIRGLTLDDFHDNNYGCNHVWLEFKVNGEWWSMDCERVAPRSLELPGWPAPCETRVAVEDMEILAASGYGWSSCFDRGQLPDMREEVPKLVREAVLSSIQLPQIAGDSL